MSNLMSLLIFWFNSCAFYHRNAMLLLFFGLFSLIYALNLEYPRTLKNIFEFIQRVLLSLGPKSLKPKLQSLKTLLRQ